MSYRTVSKTYAISDLPFTSVNSDELLSGELNAEIEKRIKAVIRDEAPIHEWLLIKRVINSFDLYKAGSRIKTHMDAIMKEMKLNALTDKSGTVYWKAKQKPADYNVYRLFGAYDLTCRDVLYVPDIEIANAAASIAAKEALAYEDLARQTAALMGYTRMGTNVAAGMKRGIAYAVKTKRISVKSGKYVN